jgi:hypothetical protein
MKTRNLKPLAAAIGLALASPVFAAGLDFSGSNIYMKFLDGNQRNVNTSAPDGAGDTAHNTDNGQWTEFELRIKATISRQVEAGIRLQSRSPAAYWTDFGGFGGPENTPTRASNMKLRGAYVLLTPGYSWLNTALIGSNDWSQFDPFTVGRVRYIDRENYKGLYLKGPLYGGGTWEAGRLSLPNYLQSNYGQGPSCCSSDETQFNEAVYIAQVKKSIGPVKLTGSAQIFQDHVKDPATTPFDGNSQNKFASDKVFMLKGEGSPMDGVDVRGAAYRSIYKAPLFDQPWTNSPKSSISDSAYKLDLTLGSLPVPGLTVNYQYFNIGAGYYSNTAARHESDVLLTEGSEAAWFRWGDPIWTGGAAKDYNQGPASALCHVSGGGACRSDSGLAPGANGLVNNENMDFDEAPSQSVQGWKGHTLLVSYEVAKIPLSFEYSRIGYNYDWQNYSATGPLSNYFALNNDRKTNVLAFKASYVVPVAGGVELGFKYKLVDDKNKGDNSTLVGSADDRDTKDTGYTLSAGNQLFGDLYGSVSYGNYKRDIRAGAATFNNDKDIWSLRASYNLSGLEIGALAQWIKGKGDPLETGTRIDINQYRMKAFLKAIF